jgi:hypothetical protein
MVSEDSDYTYGTIAYSCSECFFKDNDLIGLDLDKGSGFWLNAVRNSTFERNDASHFRTGIEVYTDCWHNTFTLNRLRDNHHSAFVNGSAYSNGNMWDDNVSQGNFWDDYPGTGDYIIEGPLGVVCGVDRFPGFVGGRPTENWLELFLSLFSSPEAGGVRNLLGIVSALIVIVPAAIGAVVYLRRN